MRYARYALLVAISVTWVGCSRRALRSDLQNDIPLAAELSESASSETASFGPVEGAVTEHEPVGVPIRE